jgi:hypothetical protein
MSITQTIKMKKEIKDENFAEILQIVIKVHHKRPDTPLMEILDNAIGLNDYSKMTDEQLLEQLTKFYGIEIK